MNAVDTNVLVRFLVRDDEAQARCARKIIEKDKVFIPKTVMLETEWILRYTYEFSRKAVNAALEKLCGLSQVKAEDASVVRQALQWHGKGLDFADALHLASSQKAQAFYSFDRSLAQRAAQMENAIPIRQGS